MDIKKLKSIDWILVITVVFIFLYGLIVISSATHVNFEKNYKKLQIQAVAFFLGILVMLFMMMIDYNDFKKYQKHFYVINILLLLLVYVPGLGVEQMGARSWINLKVVYFQTSELVKVFFTLGFAAYIENKKGNFKKIKDLIPIGLYSGPILLMIFKQPDLGTMLVFVLMIFGMLYVSGITYKLILKCILIVVLCLPLLYPFLGEHQKVRLVGFMNMKNSEYQGNYQVNQSIVAIGSGKILGKGLYKGTQSQYKFLPVQESDFIFAVVGEELGFLGGFVLVVLFFLFLFRILLIARTAKDFYGTLITTSLLFMFFYQVFQNIGMTIGLIPVTGVTLPFFSYGGTSMVISMMALGVVLNVSMRRKKINF